MMTPDEILKTRHRHFGRGLSVSYREPLTIVKGRGQYLFDQNGRRYLDCVNNVCHVGHCHPHVVEAATRQIAELNTNTRYLHPNLASYVEALTSHFPDPLNVCYLVNSGSEATELALRMARNFTGNDDLIVLEAGYHGNTAAAVAASHYKFGGPGGKGCPANTHMVPIPCQYRGIYRGQPDSGTLYAKHVSQRIAELESENKRPAAFIAESMLGVAGQIILPDGFLKSAYQSVRDAGGLCIADEVQVGFARPGSTFWAFELQDVVPDIVTLGKPIGNGHPLAAVITTAEVADAFNNGMEFFNTFGGNPVSCAIGMAVLEVIENESLQQHAETVGQQLLTDLQQELSVHPLIGDIRGQGMFIGIELIAEPETLQPATQQAYDLVNIIKEQGILLSVDGPHENVIKFKPPMVFNRQDAGLLVETLRNALKSCSKISR